MKKIWRWLMEPFEPMSLSVHVISREATKLRLHEWRADPGLCNRARKLLDHPDAQLLISVLHNEHPAFIVADPGTQLQDRAVLQARAEGYTLALANLEAMSKHEKTHEIPEADFLPEEVEK